MRKVEQGKRIKKKENKTREWKGISQMKRETIKRRKTVVTIASLVFLRLDE